MSKKKYEWCHVWPNGVVYVYRYKDGRCGPFGPFYLKVRNGNGRSVRWFTCSGRNVLRVLSGVPGAILRHQITKACREGGVSRLRVHLQNALDSPYNAPCFPIEVGISYGGTDEELIEVRIKDLDGFLATVSAVMEDHEIPLRGLGYANPIPERRWVKGPDHGLVHPVDYDYIVEALTDAGAIEEDLAILKARLGLS